MLCPSGVSEVTLVRQHNPVSIKGVALLSVIWTMCLLTGCQSVEVDQLIAEPIFFPPLPAVPRLQFLTSFSGPEGFSPRATSGFERFVLGEPKALQGIASPYGMALFEGKTVRLQDAVKVPHMGWNTLRLVKQNEFFEGVEDESYVYFVHSLYPVPADKEIVATETEYGATFTSAIASKNVFGTQFHPEKSGDIGLKILENFANMVKR